MCPTNTVPLENITKKRKKIKWLEMKHNTKTWIKHSQHPVESYSAHQQYNTAFINNNSFWLLQRLQWCPSAHLVQASGMQQMKICRSIVEEYCLHLQSALFPWDKSYFIYIKYLKSLVLEVILYKFKMSDSAKENMVWLKTHCYSNGSFNCCFYFF